jgi:hypothetical protein
MAKEFITVAESRFLLFMNVKLLKQLKMPRFALELHHIMQ